MHLLHPDHSKEGVGARRNLCCGLQRRDQAACSPSYGQTATTLQGPFPRPSCPSEVARAGVKAALDQEFFLPLSTAPLEKEQQRPPRLGELTVTDETPDSLRLSWTVAQGLFDSFVVQYRDTAGQPRAVPVAPDQREVTIEGLEPGRKYKFLLYGIHGGQRLGPISVLGVTGEQEDLGRKEGCPGLWRNGSEEGPALMETKEPIKSWRQSRRKERPWQRFPVSWPPPCPALPAVPHHSTEAALTSPRGGLAR